MSPPDPPRRRRLAPPPPPIHDAKEGRACSLTREVGGWWSSDSPCSRSASKISKRNGAAAEAVLPQVAVAGEVAAPAGPQGVPEVPFLVPRAALRRAGASPDQGDPRVAPSRPRGAAARRLPRSPAVVRGALRCPPDLASAVAALRGAATRSPVVAVVSAAAEAAAPSVRVTGPRAAPRGPRAAVVASAIPTARIAAACASLRVRGAAVVGEEAFPVAVRGGLEACASLPALEAAPGPDEGRSPARPRDSVRVPVGACRRTRRTAVVGRGSGAVRTRARASAVSQIVARRGSNGLLPSTAIRCRVASETLPVGPAHARPRPDV